MVCGGVVAVCGGSIMGQGRVGTMAPPRYSGNGDTVPGQRNVGLYAHNIEAVDHRSNCEHSVSYVDADKGLQP